MVHIVDTYIPFNFNKRYFTAASRRTLKTNLANEQLCSFVAESNCRLGSRQSLHSSQLGMNIEEFIESNEGSP